LREAVDEGLISASAAAAVVRAGEGELGGTAAVRKLGKAESTSQAASDELTAARERVDEVVAAARAGTSVMTNVAQAEEANPPWAEIRVALTRTEGRLRGVASLGGKLQQFELYHEYLFVGPAPTPDNESPEPVRETVATDASAESPPTTSRRKPHSTRSPKSPKKAGRRP
jgi:hypothetical protein